MSKIDDLTRLKRTQQAASEALEFSRGGSRETLERDRKLTLALVKEIEIIGEAAAKVSAACRERHPQLPWQQIVGMRNRLIHAYHDVDLAVLWDTVTLSLQPLLQAIESIITQEETPSQE